MRFATDLFMFVLFFSSRPTKTQGWVPAPAQTIERSFVLGTPSMRDKGRIIWATRTSVMPILTKARISGDDSMDTPLQQQAPTVSIRECLYGDLGECADVIMSAFYTNYKSPFKHLTRLAELNRLQQSFSYDKNNHMMFVAVVEEDIVGFVDIDLRPPNMQMPYSYNPRPYLSDLCVHTSFQRRGIGHLLIQQCELFCVRNDKNVVFIRVQSDNTVAVDLYMHLGYAVIDNPDCSDGSILILKKKLGKGEEKVSDEKRDSVLPDNRQGDDMNYVI